MSKAPFGLVSVVIANHNYAEFLPHAIESALALDWPEVEVVVVDDGSTDDSRAVLERYAGRVTALTLPKSGQIAAYNAGFAASRGEVVILLDADDVLERELVQKLASVWRPGVSKVQVQMRTVDRAGQPLGSVFPQYPVVPTAEDVRRWITTTGDYPTPPGSGNAYARSFLERIFPLSGFDDAADSHCVTAAAYLGDVLTLPEPLVRYRVHGRNIGAMSKLDGARLNREVARAAARVRYGREVARAAGIPVPPERPLRSWRALPYRLASLRLAPDGHPIPRDTRWKVLFDAAVALGLPQGHSLKQQLTLLAWLGAVATLPRTWAEKLVLWRFAAGSRPASVRRALQRLRIVATA